MNATRGARVVYRRRAQRTVAALAFLLIAFVSVVDAVHAHIPALPAAIAALAAAVSVRLWFAATVIADDGGITVRELYKTRFLPWSSVTRFDTSLVYLMGQTRRCLIAHTTSGNALTFRGFSEMPRRKRPSAIEKVCNDLNARRGERSG